MPSGPQGRKRSQNMIVSQHRRRRKTGIHRRKKGWKEERLYDTVQERPDIEPEKIGSLEITCLNCGGHFPS